jgi:hypothetical protein
LAVDENLAGVEVVEAFQEGDDGCFAAAGGAHDADGLAALDFEVEVAEDGVLGTGGVGEAHFFEFDGDFGVVGGDLGSSGAVDGRLLFSKMEDLVGSCMSFRGV